MTPSESGRLGGLKNKGEANGNAKLTRNQAAEIRLLFAGGIGRNVLAKWYGVHPSTISKVTTGKRWAP